MTSPSALTLRRVPQVEKTWEDLCAQMLTIRQIFLYLDRSYVIAASGVRSLFEMGLQLFRTHLAAHPEVTRAFDVNSSLNPELSSVSTPSLVPTLTCTPTQSRHRPRH